MLPWILFAVTFLLLVLVSKRSLQKEALLSRVGDLLHTFHCTTMESDHPDQEGEPENEAYERTDFHTEVVDALEELGLEPGLPSTQPFYKGLKEDEPGLFDQFGPQTGTGGGNEVRTWDGTPVPRRTQDPTGL